MLNIRIFIDWEKHMKLCDEIQSISKNMEAPELLRYLINERFRGKTVVTASLRAPSIVVLKMVSDIEPSTPVIFCQRQPVFEESLEFRTQIVAQLGLTNVSMNEGHETKVSPGDRDHCEQMWVHYLDMPGRSFEILHLNECLQPYSCWISAVYHEREPNRAAPNRVDVDGRLLKIAPLHRWTKDDVREFMSAHKLPFHKLAARKFNYAETNADDVHPTYHF